MKKIRTYLLGLLSVAMIPALQSCLDDDNSWAEQFKDTLFSIGTVQALDGDDYYFLLDEGSKLYPTDRTDIRNYEAVDGQRAFVYFDELPDKLPDYDYNAKVRYVENILTKDIYFMPPEKADSIGDDPINISQIWLTRDDYLNSECLFYHSNSESIKHMLSMVVNEAATGANDEPNYVTLEFRHNANQDYQLEPGYGIVSYKLDSIASLMEGKEGLNIRVKTIYEGEKYIKVKFNEDNDTTTPGQRASVQAY